MTERLNCKAGDAAFVVLVNPSGECLQTAVESRIEPMTHIQTDGLNVNSVLHGVAGKLDMQKIGGKYSEHGPLKHVDRAISLAKRYLIGTYHQYCSRARLQLFLYEFSFRFNRRYEWSELFGRTLLACVLCPSGLYAPF